MAYDYQPDYTTDLQPGEIRPIDHVLSKLNNVKLASGGRYYTAQCPVHGDSSNSMIISERPNGSVGVSCFVGCTPRGDPRRLDNFLQVTGLTYNDLRPYNQRGEHAPDAPLVDDTDNVTLTDLIQAKFIYPAMLANFGVDEIKYKGRTVLKIPYLDENGIEHPRYRLRLSLQKGKDIKRFSWGGPSDVQPTAYGLQYLGLAQEQKQIVLTEGESDVWTLTQYRFPALGLPGAEHTDKLQPEYIDGIETVYIIDEMDKGSPAFVKGIRTRLQDFEYKGVARVVQLGKLGYAGCNDPNELNVQLFTDGKPGDFKPLFQTALDAAILIADWVDPTDDGQSPSLVSSEYVMNLPPVNWLVGGIMPQGALGMVLGKENSGKSFVSLDWACRIATGTPWAGKEVDKGSIVYIASEGLAGFGKRLRAWLLYHGNEHYADVCNNLRYVKGVVDLTTEPRREQLISLIEHATPAPKLVIIDTLAESIPGADENSSKDMGLFLAAARRLRLSTGACVLVVHHKPKSGDGSRGHSSLPGALDVKYEIEPTDDRQGLTITCTKARDTAKPEPMVFKMEQVFLSEQEYDTSCVLVPMDNPRGQTTRGMNPTQQRIYDLLEVLGRTSGKQLIERCSEIGVGRTTFYDQIRSMEYLGVVTKSAQGKGQSTYYEVVPLP